MVFQKEATSSWPLWPLRMGAGKDSPKKSPMSSDSDSSDSERGFDMADDLENGFAREVVTEFMHPLCRSNRLHRFHVARSEDKLQYWLCADDGEFLLHAKVCVEARQVEFSSYNPSDSECPPCGAKPAFTMSWNQDRTEWRVVQEKCDHCRYAPKHRCCDGKGKQQVAFIRHGQTPIGDGIFNVMEILIPAVFENGSRVLCCPVLGKGDLEALEKSNPEEVRHLITTRPVWNDEVESLVLDFKGRAALSSAKNFQLVANQNAKPVCQYAKIGSSTFSLDFKYPMSTIQAFSIALTTLFWK